MTNCIFAGNQALSTAGGIFNNLLAASTSSATITNCLFIGNSALEGGAILNYDLTEYVTVTNCTFSGNSAAFDGGGVLFANPSPNSKLDNCVFWNNSDIGGMDESAQIFVQAIPSLLDVTYTDIMGLTEPGPFCELCEGVCCNGATPNGNIGVDPKFLGGPSGTWTAVATYDSATDRTTFTDGGAMYSVDALVGQFLNPDTTQYLQSLIVSNTPTQIVVWADFHELGENNEGYKLYDYHLDSSAGSPCIDAADNNAIGACSLDLDGNERFVDDPNVFPNRGLGSPEHPDDIVDMGAYEFGGDPELDCDGNALADSCCPADFNFDGIVNAFDLATLLGAWGDCPDCEVGVSTCDCRADFDNSCDVKAFDLAQLLGDWGPCP